VRKKERDPWGEYIVYEGEYAVSPWDECPGIKRPKAGYVLFEWKGKDGQSHIELRKPTPRERMLIVKHYIIDHPGRPITVGWLAGRLNVSERTVQLLLRTLERGREIRQRPHLDKNGRRDGSVFDYTGIEQPKGRRARVRPTMQNLYDPENPYGYRSWSWEDYKFVPGWNAIDGENDADPGAYDDLLDKREAQAKAKEKFAEGSLSVEVCRGGYPKKAKKKK
jgi:hypothetical protein